jgi:uncharacterized tellurite resistance protein B-like protein
MFLHTLNDSEREAFLALARDYIQADQKVSFQEEAMLKQLCLEIGLAPDHSLPKRPRKEWLAQIAQRRSQVAAMLELLALANADKCFDARERELVFETANVWGITKAELEKMANWHDRQIELLGEAFLMMELPEPPPLPGRSAGKKKAEKKPIKKPVKKKPAKKKPAKKK